MCSNMNHDSNALRPRKRNESGMPPYRDPPALWGGNRCSIKTIFASSVTHWLRSSADLCITTCSGIPSRADSESRRRSTAPPRRSSATHRSLRRQCVRTPPRPPAPGAGAAAKRAWGRKSTEASELHRIISASVRDMLDAYRIQARIEEIIFRAAHVVVQCLAPYRGAQRIALLPSVVRVLLTTFLEEVAGAGGAEHAQ